MVQARCGAGRKLGRFARRFALDKGLGPRSGSARPKAQRSAVEEESAVGEAGRGGDAIQSHPHFAQTGSEQQGQASTDGRKRGASVSSHSTHRAGRQVAVARMMHLMESFRPVTRSRASTPFHLRRHGETSPFGRHKTHCCTVRTSSTFAVHLLTRKLSRSHSQARQECEVGLPDPAMRVSFTERNLRKICRRPCNFGRLQWQAGKLPHVGQSLRNLMKNPLGSNLDIGHNGELRGWKNASPRLRQLSPGSWPIS